MLLCWNQFIFLPRDAMPARNIDSIRNKEVVDNRLCAWCRILMNSRPTGIIATCRTSSKHSLAWFWYEKWRHL